MEILLCDVVMVECEVECCVGEVCEVCAGGEVWVEVVCEGV